MKLISLFILYFLFFSNSVQSKDICADNVPSSYKSWHQNLKLEMESKGIKKKTLDSVFNECYFEESPTVIKADRNQVEFILSPTQYINRVVSKQRVNTAQKKYKELLPLLKKIEAKYGVQPEYLVAFWGVETNFGGNFGGHNLFKVLFQLSYDKRRRSFFEAQLLDAMKMVDNNNLDYKLLQSSWAGAMGHYQFMPSTFNAYAVSYNKGAKINIWSSYEDASSSAANYLSSIGWDRSQPSVVKVKLPWRFEYLNSGRRNKKTIKEWNNLGVRLSNNKKINQSNDTLAALIVPEGKNGDAYLVFNNFYKIMNWNFSENYALAISILADYIKSGDKWKAVPDTYNIKLTKDDIVVIQKFINAHKIAKIDEDGELGTGTKIAIQKLQNKLMLPADGYPNYQLLNRIKNHNPRNGFSIPVPPIKTHK